MLLQLEKVRKEFRQPNKVKTILSSLSLELPTSGRLVIIGRSGCGKTTLLRLIAGFERPTAGQILFAGKEVVGPDRSRLMVFQEPRLLPWATIHHNIALAVDKHSGANEGTGVVSELLSLVGLHNCGHLYPDQISGGMAQRVALARALAGKPRVLLMDEPLGSLDAFTRSELQQQLIAIWKKHQQTVVFVTHDIEEAILLGDRIIVLGNEGRILADIDVDLPVDRLRTDKAFNEIREQLMLVLFDQTGEKEGL